MIDFSGKICPYCKTAFSPDDEVVICSLCEMPHHKECWVANQGCTTFGCLGTIKSASGESFSNSSFDISIAEDKVPTQNSVFCTRCGAQNNSDSSFCVRCGNRLSAASINIVSQQNSQSSSMQSAASPFAYTQANPANNNPYSYVANNQYANRSSQTSQTSANPYDYRYQYNSQNTQANDMSRLIGDNSDYYIRKFQEMKSQNNQISWNWSAFLFSFMWLLMRKMPIIAIPVNVILIIILHINSAFGSILMLAAAVVFGVFGNYIYMNYIDKQAEKAKTMAEPSKTEFIAKNGGTSRIYVAIGLIVNLIVNTIL